MDRGVDTKLNVGQASSPRGSGAAPLSPMERRWRATWIGQAKRSAVGYVCPSCDYTELAVALKQPKALYILHVLRYVTRYVSSHHSNNERLHSLNNNMCKDIYLNKVKTCMTVFLKRKVTLSKYRCKRIAQLMSWRINTQTRVRIRLMTNERRN